MRQSRPVRLLFLILLSIVVLSPLGVEVTRSQQRRKPFVPVTDTMLQNPGPADWLMWRRTLNGWGYSPLDSSSRCRRGRSRFQTPESISSAPVLSPMRSAGTPTFSSIAV